MYRHILLRVIFKVVFQFLMLQFQIRWGLDFLERPDPITHTDTPACIHKNTEKARERGEGGMQRSVETPLYTVGEGNSPIPAGKGPKLLTGAPARDTRLCLSLLSLFLVTQAPDRRFRTSPSCQELKGLEFAPVRSELKPFQFCSCRATVCVSMRVSACMCGSNFKCMDHSHTMVARVAMFVGKWHVRHFTECWDFLCSSGC